MDISIQNSSYLELIIGPMFSGKTSHLILLYKLYTISNKKVCVINYIDDKRYDQEKMSSHDMDMIPCIQTKELYDLRKINNIFDYDVYLINEGQFFKDIYTFTRCLIEKHNKIVYVSGLDGNYKREPFGDGSLLRLIPICDNVIRKTSICKHCNNGTKAIFTHRLSDDKEEKLIGSNEYIPLCRKCYIIKNENTFNNVNVNVNVNKTKTSTSTSTSTNIREVFGLSQ